MANPLISRATRKARDAEASRNRKIRWVLAGAGAFFIVAVAVIYFTAFSGKSADGKPQTQEEVDALSLSSLDALIEEGNAAMNDPSATAAMKAKWQKDRAALEKQRKDLIARHPEWGKK